MIVPDTAGTAWRERRAHFPRGDWRKFKILMIGHLHSTSNRSGLPVFFDEVLPELVKRWGVDGFEVHFVGKNDAMPERFDKWRKHPSLVFRGPVYPADDEFYSSDVVLVTVPAETGPRTRILNAFTYGCAVVAHTSNALGIPELRHEENILLGENGAALARELVRLAEDPLLGRKLGENGRATYERYYSAPNAGEEYLDLIRRTVAV
jgi:glycosyltransferase involved in cell wall biosynthesis